MLTTNEQRYLPGQWYDVRVVLDGPRLAVYVDGQKDLEASDARFASGTVALYSWGNSGVTFRHVRFKGR